MSVLRRIGKTRSPWAPDKTQYRLLTEQILERSVDLESGYFTANSDRSQIQDKNFSQSRKMSR